MALTDLGSAEGLGHTAVIPRYDTAAVSLNQENGVFAPKMSPKSGNIAGFGLEITHLHTKGTVIPQMIPRYGYRGMDAAVSSAV